MTLVEQQPTTTFSSQVIPEDPVVPFLIGKGQQMGVAQLDPRFMNTL